MPVRYQGNFEQGKKCPENYAERLRFPGCSLGNRPFTPFNKGPPPPPQIPSFPRAPKINKIPLEPPYTVPQLKHKVPPSENVIVNYEKQKEFKEYEKLLAGRRGNASFKGELPERVVTTAKMTEAVYAANKAKRNGVVDWMQVGKDYAAEHLPEWRVVDELSHPNGHSLAFQNPTSAEIINAYRGTEMDNLEDWVTNAAHGSGATDQIGQQREITAHEVKIKAFLEQKYGPNWREITKFTNTGHSKGGAHAILGADHLEVPSITHNPMIPKDRGHTIGKGTHETWSTTGDPLLGFKSTVIKHSNYTHNTIDTAAGDGGPLSEHSLAHFSQPDRPSQVQWKKGVVPETGVLGASLASGEVADEMVDKLEKVLKMNDINPQLQHVIHGVVSGIAADLTAGKMGFKSTFKTKLRSALSGVSALLVAGNLDDALTKAGFDQQDAQNISSAGGGAAAGLTDEAIDTVVNVFEGISEFAAKEFFKKLAISSMKGAGVGFALSLFSELLNHIPGGKFVGDTVHAAGDGIATYVAIKEGYDIFERVATSDTTRNILRKLFSHTPSILVEDGVELPLAATTAATTATTATTTTTATAATTAVEDAVEDGLEEETEGLEGVADYLAEATTGEDEALLEAFATTQAFPVLGRLVDLVAMVAGFGIAIKDLVWMAENTGDVYKEIKRMQAGATGAGSGLMNVGAYYRMKQEKWEKDNPKKAAEAQWYMLMHPKTDEDRARSIKILEMIISTKAKREGKTPTQYAHEIERAQNKAKQAHDEFEQQSALQSEKLGITKELYQEFVQYANTHGEHAARVELNKRLEKLSLNAGFSNIADYLKYKQHKGTRQDIMTDEVSSDKAEYQLLVAAHHNNYQYTDTYLKTNPAFKFDVDSNELTRANDLHLTTAQYFEYLHARFKDASVKDALSAAHEVATDDTHTAIDTYAQTFGDDVGDKLTVDYIESISNLKEDFDKPYVSTFEEMDPLLKTAYEKISPYDSKMETQEQVLSAEGDTDIDALANSSTAVPF